MTPKRSSRCCRSKARGAGLWETEVVGEGGGLRSISITIERAVRTYHRETGPLSPVGGRYLLCVPRSHAATYTRCSC
jgi:hypothetical protein